MLLAHSFGVFFSLGLFFCLFRFPRINKTTTTAAEKSVHKKNQPQHNHKRKYLFAFPSIYCMKILFNFFFFDILDPIYIVCWRCG